MKKRISLWLWVISITTSLILFPINHALILTRYYGIDNNNYDPRLLDIKLHFNQSIDNTIGTNSWWSYQDDEDKREFNINVRNYNFHNVRAFKNYFDQCEINYDFSYRSSFSKDKNGSKNNQTKNIDFSYSPSARNLETHHIEGTQNEVKAIADIKLEFDENSTNIRLTAFARTWQYQGGNSSWTEITSYLTIKSITFKASKFNWYDANQKLRNAFSFDKKYQLVTDTSNLMNSDNNISFNNLKIVTSNKEKIIAEIKQRIQNALGNFYYVWNNYLDFDNLILAFNENKKEVQINFKELKSGYFQTGIFPQLILKVDLIFDPKIMPFTENLTKISKKAINIVSDTSTSAFDDKNFGNNPVNLSNKQKVINEINRRIENIFMLSDQAAKKNFYNLFKISFSDEGQNNIKIYFKTSENKIFATIVKVNVTPTNEYYNKGIRDRLEINTGKVLDISKNDGSLINDKPSYDKKNNVFTYHAPIKLALALKGDDKATIMKVNGVEVPIYDQKMEIELKDRRKNKFTDRTNYKIEITSFENSKATSFSFNVIIVATTSSINFKWLGWNPTNDPNADEQYYQQWLMTQKTILNGKGDQVNNPFYRPELNPENGTIANLVYVENKNDANQKFKQDNLFLQDNYDENWNKIDLVKTAKNGYIAEAIIINSGFKNILINANGNVYRQKINKITFIPETAWEKVDLENEKQFSIPGLYHYKIQQNNFVTKIVAPIDDDPNEVLAKPGTFIHKLIYIDNNVDALKNNFCNLDFIKNQNLNQDLTIKNLWDTYQAKHLKQFLAINNFDIKNLPNLTYEKIISLWEEYVSATAKAQKLPQPDIFIALNTYKFNNLMLYSQFDFEFKKIIRERITKNLKTITTLNFEENNDYQILIAKDNINFQALDTINLKDLGNINFSNFDFYIKIKALNSSIYLSGETIFKGINSKKVNNQFFDFAQLAIYNLKNNFSQFTAKQLKAYIDNFIQNRIIVTNKKWNYKLPILNKDYQIIYDPNLATFINSNGAILSITIKTLDNSTRAIGAINFNIINDFNAALPIPVPEADPILEIDEKIDIATIFKNLDFGKIITNKDFLVKNETLFNKLLALNLAYRPNYHFKITDFDFKVIKNTPEITQVKLACKENDKFKGSVIINYIAQTLASRNNLSFILTIVGTIVIVLVSIFVVINKLGFFQKAKKKK